ncbi:hypothetical protein WA556_002186, partial [Blastocystis sp. ATCC 50177/Nand II]
MAYSVPAQDIGFTISRIGSTAKESLNIDGLSFPKNIPEPVFAEEAEMYFTSDQVKDSQVIRSLLPSYGTPTHCLLVSTPRFPRKEMLLTSAQSDNAQLEAALSEAKSQLNALKAKKNQYIMNRMTNEVAEANQQISEVLTQVIKLDLSLKTRNENEDRPEIRSLYVKEVERLLYALEDVAMEFQRDKRKEDYDTLEDNISLLTGLMEQYRDTPSLENKRQLSECYYKILDIYDV